MPWPDCEPFHSQPDGARPPVPQRPRQLAPIRSASASYRVLSRHLAHHSHCRPPSAPPKAPCRPPPTPHLPEFEPRPSTSVTSSPHFQCPHPVHPCPSVDSGLAQGLKLPVVPLIAPI